MRQVTEAKEAAATAAKKAAEAEKTQLVATESIERARTPVNNPMTHLRFRMPKRVAENAAQTSFASHQRSPSCILSHSFY